MTDSRTLDSSAWLEYFHNKKCTGIIESNTIIFSSTLSLFEVKKKLKKENQPAGFIEKCVTFIKERSQTIKVSENIAEKAMEFSLQHALGTVDAIIYATSQEHESTLITADNDFRNVPMCEMIEKTRTV